MVEDNIMENNEVEGYEVSEDIDYALAQLPGMNEPQRVRVLDMIDDSVPMVTPEVRAKRINICRSCPEFQEGTRCAQCNCTMKFRTWLDTAECPLHKW